MLIGGGGLNFKYVEKLSKIYIQKYTFFQIGKLWIRQMVVGALLVPAFVSATAFFINFIAIYYQAAKAIHFTSMVKTTCIVKLFLFEVF